ncbi:hypothetical protein C7974DRAFT_427559 [Boeremia exigua]|uniref:uncharacterized protein n=1 Tax=Boeremia exigua TaxID=749465 RepID=UPI001E8D8CCF|nr:uncharacterized protein C7974DRAFT_427559 [Boeremia exigua]KAH6616601.1 hypothetical protein C7974DRAFT_427559 [Boeremia exigua]
MRPSTTTCSRQSAPCYCHTPLSLSHSRSRRRPRAPDAGPQWPARVGSKGYAGFLVGLSNPGDEKDGDKDGDGGDGGDGGGDDCEGARRQGAGGSQTRTGRTRLLDAGEKESGTETQTQTQSGCGLGAVVRRLLGTEKSWAAGAGSSWPGVEGVAWGERGEGWREVGSVNTGSVKTGSVKTGSVNTGSVKTGSVKTGSVRVESVEAQSVQAESVDAESVQAKKKAKGVARVCARLCGGWQGSC